MKSYKTILALGAHPDDIEYGCLGLLLKQSSSAETHIYIASTGSLHDPTSGKSRLDESKKALEVLKPTSLQWREKAGFDRGDFLNILGEIQGLIEKYQPDLILTHSDKDTHQEHRELNEITIGAARRCRASILCYGTLSNTLNFHPHLFSDISGVFEQKLTALRAHKSQQGKFYMQPEYLQTFHAHNYASLHGVPICEAYEIVRIFD